MSSLDEMIALKYREMIRLSKSVRAANDMWGQFRSTGSNALSKSILMRDLARYIGVRKEYEELLLMKQELTELFSKRGLHVVQSEPTEG